MAGSFDELLFSLSFIERLQFVFFRAFMFVYLPINNSQTGHEDSILLSAIHHHFSAI